MRDLKHQIVFDWLDGHKLSEDQVMDAEYIDCLLYKLEEETEDEDEFISFEEEEAIDFILDYQEYFLSKKLQAK